MSSQDRPSGQDPGPSTPPTESDLVPVMDSTTTFPDDSSMPRQAISTGHLQPTPVVETQDANSSHTAPETPPNCPVSKGPNRSAPNQSVKLTTTTTGQKRPLPSTRLKGSIHKPFRSPLRTTQPIDTKPATVAMKKNSEYVPRTKGTTTVVPTLASTLKTRPPTRQPPPKSSTTNAPSVGKRAPFRPPLSRSQQGPPSSDTAYGRLIQIQTLQARVTELQSSIRKGQQILKQQQKNEAPIEELTAKWKKASQEGAQILLEKYTKQQSAFGGWGDYDGNRSDGRMSMDRGFRGYGSQQLPWSYNTDMPMDGVSSLQELGPDGLQALEEYIGHQDVQQDLPTVEEAIRSRSRPEVTAITHSPTKMTTMQKLLLGLGIDLDVIGYDPEQDTFIS
ncbi:hypothetical protein EC957_002295 [Mortierella hygrophila]|uniref:Swi5-dependent recombination DNA repair protein 1 n=1 Tax=Mortierella hygrophila TaxID=979708 RepID=A0A9P6K1U2_9FUNG|nr:hypothetical protein EC957_002295 [Mortierella hygrophila]